MFLNAIRLDSIEPSTCLFVTFSFGASAHKKQQLFIQCHKCRTINYDEKDPFLCNSCGFCKVSSILQGQQYFARRSDVFRKVSRTLQEQVVFCKVNNILQGQQYFARSVVFCQVICIFQGQQYSARTLVFCKASSILQRQ